MLSVLIALSSFTPQESPKAPSAVLEIVPLQHLTALQVPIAPPPWGTLLTAGYEEYAHDLIHCSREGQWFDTDAICEMLSRLHTEDIDNDRLSIHVQEDALRVFGEAQAVQKVTRDVREVGDLLTRPIEVEVTVWQAGDLTDVAAVNTPADYGRMVANLQPLWRSVRSTHSNGVAAHDRQRWVRYVRDVDTEVAQKAKIALPVTDAFCDGGRVVVVPHSLASGDDLVLHVQFGFGVPRGSVRTVPSGLQDAPELDLPTLATTFGAFSGRIQNGGALAVLATGDESCGERLLLTVRATASTPPNDPQLNDLAAFPTSALTNAALLMRMTPPSPYPALGDQTARTMELSDEDQTYTRFEPDELLELLRTSLGELADTDDFSMDIAGGFLFVHAPRTTITIVGDLLRGLESRLLRNVQVRHFGTIDQGRGSAPLHELVAPSLLGRELIVVRLLETSFVRELQAEIAQESSTLEPQLETAQSGTWLRLRAANPSGETHVDMLAQTVHVRALRPRNVNPGGLLMPNDVSSCRCLHDGKAVNGKVIDHGDGPIVTLGDTALRTTLSTIVKW